MSSQFENFVRTISAVNKEINRIKGLEMRRFGLKGTDVMCLYFLERSQMAAAQGKDVPEATAAELARRIGQDRAAVSRSVARLEEGGFVSAELGSEGQRYRSALRLTERGLRATREVNEIIATVVEHACEGVCQEDRDAMYRALEAIRNNLETIG